MDEEEKAEQGRPFPGSLNCHIYSKNRVCLHRFLAMFPALPSQISKQMKFVHCPLH